MKLRRQIFSSLVLVAVIPLIAIYFYMFVTNIRLSFELYGQNLYNATEMQSDVLSDFINRSMVRAARFANSRYLKEFFSEGYRDGAPILADAEAVNEIQKFTDDTLGSITMFAIVDTEGDFLYSSGSNQDAGKLKENMRAIMEVRENTLLEFAWSEKADSIVMVLPITREYAGEILGRIVVAYSNDYFLKAISSHKQMESTNSFIYCTDHDRIVKTKREMKTHTGLLPRIPEDISEGSMTENIDGNKTLIYYKKISRTPWILVNTLLVKQVYLSVINYGFFSVVTFLVSIFAIVLLSRILSGKALEPLNQLLNGVESFFMSGAEKLPDLEMDEKTEVGYLASRFAAMASDISAAQQKLRETDYLYEAIRRAAYTLLIGVDFETREVFTSSQDLNAWFQNLPEKDPAAKLLHFFETRKTRFGCPGEDMLRDIAYGKILEPAEVETCCNMGGEKAESWFRILAVPVMDKDGRILKAVLHFEDITGKKQEELRLLETAQKDLLCGILNKQAFFELAEAYLKQKHGGSAVYFIDLDNFKEVNDKLGHTAGDEVLISVAHVLSRNFRSGDLVARFGGDEFAVFAPGMPYDKAERKAEILIDALKFKKTGPGGSVLITASAGVFVSSGDVGLREMLRRADKAMYLTKQNGKSGFHIVSDSGGGH